MNVIIQAIDISKFVERVRKPVSPRNSHREGREGRSVIGGVVRKVVVEGYRIQVIQEFQEGLQ